MPKLNGSGNVLLTDDVIASEALRLLKNELVAARLVHRDLENSFGAGKKIGDTINVKLPFRTKTASGRTLVKQPMVDRTTSLKIDRQEHFGLEFTQNDRTLSLMEFSSRYLASGISQLAHVVDRSILDTMHKGFFNASGTPGTAITTDSWVDARSFMGLVGVPFDGKVSTILHLLDGGAIAKDVKKLAHEGLVKQAIERSYIGPLAHMNAFETAQMPILQNNTFTGVPLVDGAVQTGSTLVTDGWTGSLTNMLIPGMVFTIDGVYEVNPRTYESTGKLQGFTVTAAASSSSGGVSSLQISPAINDGTLTTVDADGNVVSLAAYQNVSAAPANNAPITIMGLSNTAYRQDFAFHRDAIALAVVPIEIPESAVVKKRVTDPQTGLSLLMTAAYDINNFSQIYRIDVLWGTKAIYPELGHKIISDNL
jgi:hypothetical protein